MYPQSMLVLSSYFYMSQTARHFFQQKKFLESLTTKGKFSCPPWFSWQKEQYVVNWIRRPGFVGRPLQTLYHKRFSESYTCVLSTSGTWQVNLTSCACQVDLSPSPPAPLQITWQVTDLSSQLVKSTSRLYLKTLPPDSTSRLYLQTLPPDSTCYDVGLSVHDTTLV